MNEIRQWSRIIILPIILLCISNPLFSQNNHSKSKQQNQTYIVIEKEAYLLTEKAIDKMELGWILSVSIPTEENLKNGDPIIYYGNNYYKEQLYAVIGLKEDNNIYTTLNAYADFKYSTGKTMEESIELFFKENYKVPEKKQRKKYWWKAYISAIVEKDGSLSNITINNDGINAIIDTSIINFVKQMPPWIPAQKNGDNVRSKCMFGVYFEWFNEK